MKTTEILYVSPSVLPSKSANSVHVFNQCNALAQDSKVTLICGRTVFQKSLLKDEIEATYGTVHKNLEIVSGYLFLQKGALIIIALIGLFKVLNINRRYKVISRNLYFSVIIMLLGRKSIYETHLVEFGVRGYLQKVLLANSSTECIVISQALKDILLQKYPNSKSNITVLHDAANVIKSYPNNTNSKEEHQSSINFWNYRLDIDVSIYANVVGYFGHLYKGRGVDNIIIPAAKRMSQTFFVVVGGTEIDVEFNKKIASKNVYFWGYQPHSRLHEAMKNCDVLLMPYQKQVSIGISQHDTAKWMSPLKMFEYMSSGRPIISSNLPVLSEVLLDEKNALMVEPEDQNAWVKSIERLLEDRLLSERISERAKYEISTKYSWSRRAKSILELLQTT